MGVTYTEVSIKDADTLHCGICGKVLTTWIWTPGDDGLISAGMPEAFAYCCGMEYVLAPTAFSLKAGEDKTELGNPYA